ncbi:hypothetical protein D3C80_1725740 [compost metagenome]
MFHHRNAEHLHFRGKPTRHQVEAVSALRNIVDRRRHLRRDDRVKGRDMRRREKLQIRGHGSQGRGPGKRVHVHAVEVRRPAETAPPGDRHHAFPSGRFELFGNFDIVFESRFER